MLFAYLTYPGILRGALVNLGRSDYALAVGDQIRRLNRSAHATFVRTTRIAFNAEREAIR